MKYTAFFLWKTTILQHCGVRLLLEYRLHTMRVPECPTVVPQAVDNSRPFVGKINPHEVWDSSFFRINLSTHEFNKKIPILCKKGGDFFIEPDFITIGNTNSLKELGPTDRRQMRQSSTAPS